jgi:cysteine desulfurase
MKNKLIYLDFNACTPLAAQASEAMVYSLRNIYGNPSSSHWAGRMAYEALEAAREQVSHLLNAHPSEVIFTSGGTESNNLAIRGVLNSEKHRGNHIITSMTEHPATFNVCKHLEDAGVQVTYLTVDSAGRINLDELRESIRPETILITIMHANNETGTLQPIKEIADIAKSNGIFFHSDAAQSTGKMDVDTKFLNVDMMSITGQKFYGPKGSGALYIRKGLKLNPICFGADQEKGLRPGTEALPSIVGLGSACDVAKTWLASSGPENIRALKDSFWNNFEDKFHGSVIFNGHQEYCLPNTLSISFPGISARWILEHIPELSASLGSACHSGHDNPSRVLLAMGKTEKESLGTIRFSLGRETTSEELDWVVNRLAELIPSTKLTHFEK